MQQSTIQIEVELDDNKIPANIRWQASGSSVDKPKDAKAMLLAMWDNADKTALRIDLWTKDMMMDEMADFFYQTFMTMADTYERATHYNDQAVAIKTFAGEFLKQFKAKQNQ